MLSTLQRFHPQTIPKPSTTVGDSPVTRTEVGCSGKRFIIQEFHTTAYLWLSPFLCNPCLCTILVYVQYLFMYNTCLCTILVYVQYSFICNTCLCTILVYAQYLWMCKTCLYAILVYVQYCMYTTCLLPIPIIGNSCECSILGCAQN